MTRAGRSPWPTTPATCSRPGAVFVDEDDVIVGWEAVRNAAVAPDRYAECFKRDMGSPRFRRKIGGLEVPPEVLSAFVLERLKRDAEQRLGPIRDVVITVPAFFDETRRRATQDAGRLAGLDVLDIINEPTAAALAYGYQRGLLRARAAAAADRPERVLVYDLGGGTFDVTILEIDGPRFHALATDGDVWLGGKDFDERLVNYLAEQFLAAHGVDPRSDPQDAAQLWLDAQEAKHALSERQQDHGDLLPRRDPHADRGHAQHVRGADPRPAGAHRDHDLAGARAGGPGLAADRPRAAGGRVEPHAHGRPRCSAS